MDEETYREIAALLEECDPGASIQDQIAHIAKQKMPLVWKICHDWLDVTYPTWKMAYDGLAHIRLRGRLGVSPFQRKVLTRMRDKGHGIVLVDGFYRWNEGYSDELRRNAIQSMLERGWLKFEQYTYKQLTMPRLVPTEKGLDALARAEIGRRDI